MNECSCVSCSNLHSQENLKERIRDAIEMDDQETLKDLLEMEEDEDGEEA